jgi:hypothetical protein
LLKRLQDFQSQFKQAVHFRCGDCIKWLDPKQQRKEHDAFVFKGLINNTDIIIADLPPRLTKHESKNDFDVLTLESFALFITRLRPMLKSTGTLILLCSPYNIHSIAKVLKKQNFVVEKNTLTITKHSSLINSASVRSAYSGIVAHVTSNFFVRHNNIDANKLKKDMFTERAVEMDAYPSFGNVIHDYRPPSVYLTPDRETWCASTSTSKKRTRTTPVRTEEKNADLWIVCLHRWCPPSNNVAHIALFDCLTD